MPERRRQSLFWPLVLILLGLALLTQQLGLVEWSWGTVLRLWPLLLILAGLDILLGRSTVSGLVLVVIGLALVAATVLVIGWFGPLGDQASLREVSLSAQGVERATVRIDAGVGRLRVAPIEDGHNLIEARVALGERRGELVFEHEVTGGEAGVRLASRQTSWAPFVEPWDNGWQVFLAPAVPMTLRINGGVNSVEADLRDLTVADLDVSLGVGSAEIALAPGDYAAHIQGGVGSIVVVVPEDAQARILVDGALGSIEVDPRFEQQDAYYVSRGFAPGADTLRINVEGGIGSVTVRSR